MRDSDLDRVRAAARQAAETPGRVGLVSPGVSLDQYRELAEAFLALDRKASVEATMEQIRPAGDRRLAGPAAAWAEHLRLTLLDTGYPLPCCHAALDGLVGLAVRGQEAGPAGMSPGEETR